MYLFNKKLAINDNKQATNTSNLNTNKKLSINEEIVHIEQKISVVKNKINDLNISLNENVRKSYIILSTRY